MAHIPYYELKKESGIEWVGKIPDHWKVLKNNRLFTISKQLVGDDWENTQLLSLTKSGIVKKDINSSGGKQPESFATYQTVKKKDIVLCLFDIDVSAVFSDTSNYDGMISPAYRVMQCTPLITPEYAKWWFAAVNTGRYYLIYTKSLRKTIDQNNFGNILTLVPPIAEQIKINEFLTNECDRIDSILENAKQSIEEYGRWRQSIIDEAVLKGVRKNTRFKSTGAKWITSIPDTWEMIPAKALFTTSDVRTQPGDEQLTASQKYGIITQQEYMEKEQTRIVLATQGLDQWKHVEPNDFIISLRSFQGGLEISNVTGCITWHYIVLKPKAGVYPDYYKWFFKSAKYINALQSTCNFIRDGQDLRFSNFVQVPLCKIPMAEQKEIADHLNEMIPKIDSLIEEKKKLIDDLESYRKAIIYEVATGKRKVV